MSRVALQNKCINELFPLQVNNHTLPLVVHRKAISAIYGKALCRTIYLHILGQKVIHIAYKLRLTQRHSHLLRRNDTAPHHSKECD